MEKRGRKPMAFQADETQAGTPQTSDGTQTKSGVKPCLLPLKNGLVFKMVFGDHRYIAAIRAFLTTVLDIPAEEYEGLEIIDSHLEPDSPDDKQGIGNVLVQLKNKRLISVEVQARKTPYMAERITFSTIRNLERQIDAGQSCTFVGGVATIVIADYDIVPDDKWYHHVFRWHNQEHSVFFADLMEIHTLELRKLPENAGADGEDGELLDWLRLIKSESEEEIEMLATKTEEIKMTVDRLKQLSEDERTRILDSGI
jgi:predicted transposase/invertase (TIGR01784 family)